MKYKHIIWDIDGTLMDAGEGVINSIKEVLNLHGYDDFTHEQLVAMHAMPLIQDAFQQACALTEKQAEAYANEFREIYKTKHLFEAVLYPHIEDVMKQCRELGLIQAVATNKRQDYATLICEHFGITNYCDPIVGSDGQAGKSKIHVLERCLQQLKVTNRQGAVMIGDTDGDRRASSEAGVGFIGVNYGYGFRAEPGYANSPEEILARLI